MPIFFSSAGGVNACAGVLPNFPVPLFRNSPDQVYGKEKHNAKILSIYWSKFDEKSQNYPSIKVQVKWSLGEFKRFFA